MPVVNLKNRKRMYCVLFLIMLIFFTGPNNLYRAHGCRCLVNRDLTGVGYSAGEDPPWRIYYVSPDGNDENAGNITHPFKTISHARDVIRNISAMMTGDIIVYLRDGNYHLSDTLKFNQSDGGKNGYEIIYKAYGNETPVIDGGEVITSNWELHDGNILRCFLNTSIDFRQLYIRTAFGSNHNTDEPDADNVPEYPYAGSPTSLSVMTPAYDGSDSWERRAIRARALVPPDTFAIEGEGYKYLKADGFWSDLSAWKTPFGGILDGFPETIGDATHYAQDIEFVYHLMWNLPRVHIYTVGEYQGENRILMQEPAFQFVRTKGGTQLGNHWAGQEQPIWIENAYALLDEPGEWYFDKHTGWLFYYPLHDEPAPNSTDIQFIIPRTETLLEINGTESQPVENIKFEGITFKHSNWLRPNKFGLNHVDLQANFLITQSDTGRTHERSPGAVIVSYAKNINFDRCIFTKLGSAALDLFVGAQDCVVQGCIFDDVSGTGVNVGDIDSSVPEGSPKVPRNNSIQNNYFTNIAVEYKGGHGIWTGYVQDCKIEHNEISGTAYTTIAVGWGWSGKQTICHDNSINYNHISNFMMEMKDGGAIYTLSLQNGTRVQYNHIHDGGGSALYPDEQTWMTSWNFNVGYRCGNSLQDHTLGEERTSTSIRENNISGNYFDMLPIIEPARQQSHIPNNIWDIGPEPNSTVLSIVAASGLEPEYQDLLTGSEQIRRKTAPGLYWSDAMTEETEILNPNYVWIALIINVAILSLGIYLVFTKRRTIDVTSKANIENKGGIKNDKK
ncbi:MAG: right-handed parallel beta-helix repeat-containing protein [Promethearchaeota archaeon]